MRDVTLLWALRSPCNLGCRYCYFGTIEEHRIRMPPDPGQLSHLSRNDLTQAEIVSFLSTISESAVRRIFIAGGEPLVWPPTLAIVKELKAANVEVIICTNGIPLNQQSVTTRIVELEVDAVSVSIDSVDAEYNDHYRPSRSGTMGWKEVVSGIQHLLSARGAHPAPRVGLYAVITRKNINSVSEIAQLGVDLGVDYYVPQPISLANDHALHSQLELCVQDAPDLISALYELYLAKHPIDLPDHGYADQFASTVVRPELGLVHNCFGGHTLFFIEPDGSIWDCPSRYRIAATPRDRRRSIRGHNAAELFSPDRSSCPVDCGLFSRDCVNMWPLMQFDRFSRMADGRSSGDR